jgi:hypothetical protein
MNVRQQQPSIDRGNLHGIVPHEDERLAEAKPQVLVQRRLVDDNPAHGGHVAVSSEGVGRGSRFVVTLPLVRRNQSAGA